MIAIVNIDKNVRESGPHLYELRINRKVITTFIHYRERSLYQCLFAAALAVAKDEKRGCQVTIGEDWWTAVKFPIGKDEVSK